MPWPSKDVMGRLVSKSGGYFIYASTVIKFIDEESFSPADRLDQVLNRSNSALSPLESPPFAELDKLYLQILSTCPTSQLLMLKRILGYVGLVATGEEVVCRTVAEIEALLDLPRGRVKLLLRGLRSLVSFEEWENGIVIRLNHASFEDFLHDKECSGDYHVDFQDWLYTGFRAALSMGCELLGFSMDAGVKSTLSHSKGMFVAVTGSLYDSRSDQRIYL